MAQRFQQARQWDREHHRPIAYAATMGKSVGQGAALDGGQRVPEAEYPAGQL